MPYDHPVIRRTDTKESDVGVGEEVGDAAGAAIGKASPQAAAVWLLAAVALASIVLVGVFITKGTVDAPDRYTGTEAAEDKRDQHNINDVTSGAILRMSERLNAQDDRIASLYAKLDSMADHSNDRWEAYHSQSHTQMQVLIERLTRIEAAVGFLKEQAEK